MPRPERPSGVWAVPSPMSVPKTSPASRSGRCSRRRPGSTGPRSTRWSGVTPTVPVRRTATWARWPRCWRGCRSRCRARPVDAANRALERAGIGWSQVGAVELNEAFAVQSLVCIDAWKIDPEIVNIRGGAIAVGHPLGASGGRILGTLAKVLRDRRERYGVAAICIGVGQGSPSCWRTPRSVPGRWHGEPDVGPRHGRRGGRRDRG